MKRAVVIGGGPAGLSAGLGLLRAGYGVDVFEQRAAWKGRVCGAFLNADAVRSLAWLGALEEARRHGAPVEHATVHTSTGRSAAVSTFQDGTAGLALSRRDLEEILAAKFGAAGGRLHLGARATATRRDGGEWAVDFRRGGDAWTERTPLLILADGRFSLSDDAATGGDGWYGFNAGFRAVAQTVGELSLHFGSSAYVGLLTFSDGLTNVCGLVRRRRGDAGSWSEVLARLRADSPPLDGALGRAERVDDWRGVGPLPFTARPRPFHGAILAGDAGAVGDPFMGEGIGRALASGPLLHEAARTTTSEPALIEKYSAMWRRAYAPRLGLGLAARAALNRPWLASRVLSGIVRAGLLNRTTRLYHRGAGFQMAGATASDGLSFLSKSKTP